MSEHIEFKMYLKTVPHEEWENHSYIERSYDFTSKVERIGPMPDVLLPVLYQEIEDMFKDNMKHIYSNLMGGMTNGGNLS